MGEGRDGENYSRKEGKSFAISARLWLNLVTDLTAIASRSKH